MGIVEPLLLSIYRTDNEFYWWMSRCVLEFNVGCFGCLLWEKEMIKTIPRFPHYSITENGKVYSHKSNKFVKQHQSSTSKYLFVSLRQSGTTHQERVHHLVLETYVGPCPEGMEACHSDGDIFNNNANNLRWDTRKANRQDSIKHGTFLSGTKHPNCKLEPKDIRMIIYMWFTKLFTQKEIGKIYKIGQQKGFPNH